MSVTYGETEMSNKEIMAWIKSERGEVTRTHAENVIGPCTLNDLFRRGLLTTTSNPWYPTTQFVTYTDAGKALLDD